MMLSDARRKPVLVVAAFIVATTVAFALGKSSTQLDRRLPAGIGELHDMFDPTKPLLITGETQTTLPAALDELGYDPPIPEEDSLPGDKTPEVWHSEISGLFGLRYGSDLVLLYNRWPVGEDPAEHYAQMESDWEAGQATRIAGSPAWVVPGADADEKQWSDINSIYVSIGRVEVTLYGTVPLADLEKVAASLSSPQVSTGVGAFE
jgi:hypothetical protein